MAVYDYDYLVQLLLSIETYIMEIYCEFIFVDFDFDLDLICLDCFYDIRAGFAYSKTITNLEIGVNDVNRFYRPN